MARRLRQPFASLIACALFCLAFANPAWAQEEQDSFTDDIENLFSKEEQEAPTPAVKEPQAPETKQQSEIKDVSDLGKLSPFDDVAVIQKRYLPKTGRFQLFGGLTTVMNDAFFLNFGVNGRLGYYFRERWGVEFLALALTTSEREVTKDLSEERGVVTRTLVTPKSYYGLDVKWTPVYGKMSFLNNSIVPFDLYFSAGGGLTNTNQGASEPTLHVGTGQIFATSKATAWRWDFSWNFFTAGSNVGTSSGRSLYNNLYLTVGYSWFFPEATYR